MNCLAVDSAQIPQPPAGFFAAAGRELDHHVPKKEGALGGESRLDNAIHLPCAHPGRVAYCCIHQRAQCQ